MLLGKKIVFVINGKGASGKDTLCEIVGKMYKVKVISEITPFKEMAKIGGWNGEKDDKSRKMLSDLKMLFVNYNDWPFQYALNEINSFSKSDNEILFIHIREGQEIEKVVRHCKLPIYTLLVKRYDKKFVKDNYGNSSDDDVDCYDYDFIYENNSRTLEELNYNFTEYFNNVIISKIL